MREKKHIVANQVRLPSGTILRSFYRHDYVEFRENGEIYSVDGGTEYQRSGGNVIDCSIYSDDDFMIVREYLVWGTFGINGDQLRRWVPLCEMDDDHIQAVLDNCYTQEWRKELMELELMLRKEGKVVRKNMPLQTNVINGE